MFQEVKKVVCPDIPPFSSAEKVCALADNGYFEEEYYLYGTSNLYSRNPETNTAEKILEGAPYVNRFILRAPKDPARASGNVVVELLNPSSGMEIERMWIDAYKKFLRDGDIYVGLTVKPNTLKSLKVYSPKRYGCLQWPNPRPEVPFPFEKADMERYVFGMHMSHDFETGLCWDMITDLAHLLRDSSPENPIAAYPGRRLVLTGWSQDVSYIRTYVNYFANAMDENIFDGYLCAGGVPALFMALNQYELLDTVDSKLGRVHSCRVPFMVVQTESDASAWDAIYGKKQDSDEPGFPYRLYEIAGGSHDTQFNLLTYYQDDAELQRAAATIEIHLECVLPESVLLDSDRCRSQPRGANPGGRSRPRPAGWLWEQHRRNSHLLCGLSDRSLFQRGRYSQGRPPLYPEQPDSIFRFWLRGTLFCGTAAGALRFPGKL